MKWTSEQIEVAAQALRQVVADRANKGRPWNALPTALREQYRQEALAVLSTVGRVKGAGDSF